MRATRPVQTGPALPEAADAHVLSRDRLEVDWMAEFLKLRYCGSAQILQDPHVPSLCQVQHAGNPLQQCCCAGQ